MRILNGSIPVVLAAFAAVCGAQEPAASRYKIFPTAPSPAYASPDTPQGTGHYPAIMEADPALPTHTVYHPSDLGALGAEKLPIVAFGNGGCVNVGNRFRYFLTEIASHGFLAIATGPIRAKEVESALSSGVVPAEPAPNSPAAIRVAAGEKAGASGSLGPNTTAKQLVDAIDWAIAENSRPGSKYFGKLDTSKIAVMGQSCGGLQALDAAHDPRVTTLGVWNSGTFPEANRGLEIAAAARANKEALKTLHAPMILITGEPADVAYPNAEDDFSRIEGIPLLRAWREQTGHLGTYQEPGAGAFGKVAAAWLKWQLKDDRDSSKMFVGPDCGLCTNPEWHLKKKNID